MVAKSVIEIDVDDAAFKRFQDLFAKYEAQLAKTPGAWTAASKQMTAALMAQSKITREQAQAADQMKKAGAAGEVMRRESEATSRIWQTMGRHTGTVASNIGRMTKDLIKWSTLTGVFTGLLGVGGGLFGIDRLAMSVSSSRMRAQGIGSSIGEQKAFGVAYSTVLNDPNSALARVAEAKSDLSQRWAFSSLGVSGVDQKSPAQLAVELAAKSKAAFAQNPTEQYAQARGLTQFFSMEDLRAMQNNDLGDAASKFAGYKPGMDVTAQTSQAWANLDRQLSAAGQQIENTFVNGLVKLAGPLTKISESIVHLVQALSGSEKLKEWMDKLAEGMERLANWFSPGGAPSAPGPASGAASGDGTVRTDWGDVRIHRNNPGNLRSWGDTPVVDGYASFGSPEEGAVAMAKQLRLYQNRDHLNTVTGIISKYAPASENDTAAYIADVAKRTGYAPNQQIDLNDTRVLARLMQAITFHENSKVDINITNSTGGNANVNANQAGR